MMANTSSMVWDAVTSVVIMPTVYMNTSYLDMSTFNTTTLQPDYDLSPENAEIIPIHIHIGTVCYKYLGPIICSFGMLCNIINLLVLTQRHLKESPYTYLTGLASTDLAALVLSLIFLLVSIKQPGVYFWRVYEAYIYLPLVNGCTTSSVWLTVLLTIERFLFVRHPLLAKSICDRASAKVKTVVTIGIAFVVRVPYFFVFFVDEKGGKYFLNSTPFRMSTMFYAINIIYIALIQFLPLIILMTANVYLVYAVQRARNQRQLLVLQNNREATAQQEQTRLTVTLISIVFLFIICIIPSAFSDKPIAKALFGGGMTDDEFATYPPYLSLQYIANLLVWCNLSLNFVLYCAFNKRFRRVMRMMLQNCVQKICKPNKDGRVLMKVKFRSGSGAMSRNGSTGQTNSLTLQSKISTVQDFEGATELQMTTAVLPNNKSQNIPAQALADPAADVELLRDQ